MLSLLHRNITWGLFPFVYVGISTQTHELRESNTCKLHDLLITFTSSVGEQMIKNMNLVHFLYIILVVVSLIDSSMLSQIHSAQIYSFHVSEAFLFLSWQDSTSVPGCLCTYYVCFVMFAEPEPKYQEEAPNPSPKLLLVDHRQGEQCWIGVTRTMHVSSPESLSKSDS